MKKLTAKQIIDRIRKPQFYLPAVLGAKVALDAFGFHVLSNDQINALVNFIACIAALVGFIMGYDDDADPNS